jgi:CRP-like cAMP-binding protein
MSNRLIAALTPFELRKLLGRLEPVQLPKKEMLCRSDQPPRYVYFLESGVACLSTTLGDGGTAEIGIVGREGIICFSGVGHAVSPFDATVVIPGKAGRLRVDQFLDELNASRSLRTIVDRYLEYRFFESINRAACAALHSVHQRCCRTLLMIHDRINGTRFGLTQDSIALMLSVRRPTVTETMQALQRSGLIDYSRGAISVVNRAKLEQASCGCYADLRDRLERVYADLPFLTE